MAMRDRYDGGRDRYDPYPSRGRSYDRYDDRDRYDRYDRDRYDDRDRDRYDDRDRYERRYDDRDRDYGRDRYGDRDRYGGGGGGGGGLPRDNGATLKLSNLPFKASWQDLKDFFRRAGEVLRAEVEQRDGRATGFGWVEFRYPDDAEAALRMHNEDFMGREMRCQMLRGDGGFGGGGGGGYRGGGGGGGGPRGNNSAKVDLENLPGGVSWQDLKDLARDKVGRAVYADVRGSTGVIEFENSSDVDNAIAKLHDFEWKDQKISCRRKE